MGRAGDPASPQHAKDGRAGDPAQARSRFAKLSFVNTRFVNTRCNFVRLRSSMFCAAALCALFCCASALGQSSHPSKPTEGLPGTPSSGPVVTSASIAEIVVPRGGKAPVEIALRVNRGFHINSHQPNDELLLPTVVHLDPPEGITIMNIAYPEAQEVALPFATQKLSVYSGSFAVTAEVRAHKWVTLGTQRVRGEVRYQACNNRQCFPPKTTPLQFDVTVVRKKHHH